MNIMNKLLLIVALIFCMSLTAGAQMYIEGIDLCIYPTTSGQIEHYDGMFGLVSFNPRKNIADQKFSLYDHKGNVSSITIYRYVETKVWDEKVWSEKGEERISVYDGVVIRDRHSYELLLGKPQPNGYFSLLNSRGADEKKHGALRTERIATYMRDDEGRVEKILMHSCGKLEGMYRYLYVGFSDKISSIEWYDCNAKLTIAVKYQWEDERLVKASWDHLKDATRPSIEYTYSYDAHNNVTQINYSILYSDDDKFGKSTSTRYDFQYGYLNDLILWCNCTYGSNYNINWTFKYDSKGNWIEMIVNDDGFAEKFKRDIFYK